MQGQLFSQEFLHHGIRRTPAWHALDAATLASFTAGVHAVFDRLGEGAALSEAQTEQHVIEPLLRLLGWGSGSDLYWRQPSLQGPQRESVPDYLLFPDAAALDAALREPGDERRIRHGVALLEAKRLARPLDRGDAGEAHDPGAPSSQMLRYLSRADVVSDRRVKWGVLTSGTVWRLYWQDARSRSEEFFEIDVGALVGRPGHARDPDLPDAAHGFALLRLLFGREAFLPQPWDEARRTLHAVARAEALAYEERVAADLGPRVFDEVFPRLAEGIALANPPVRTGIDLDRPLRPPVLEPAFVEQVREATLVALYRLLFLFYAEDRRLLPVSDPRYRRYGVRGVREEVRDAIEAGTPFSDIQGWLWLRLRNVFALIAEGDPAIGMPKYNGSLFAPGRAPLLDRAPVPDAVLAPVIDALSRRVEDTRRGWINYRDLGVAHLGSLYERLLEHELVQVPRPEPGEFGLVVFYRFETRPSSFARKASGSYYTHHDLVRLVIEESVGREARRRGERFDALLEGWRRKASLTPPEWEALDAADPASAVLALAVCDPAMDSGHFLVALVDDLADRVLEAAARAQQKVAGQRWSAHLVERGRPWESPVVARIAAVRAQIRAQAKKHGWVLDEELLDDRHVVRRMVLKKCVFGVDKNPMAVELAKTALWLHTFTVGAPLSFLDHHLKCGDSLHGERLPAVQQELAALGTIFHQGELDRLALAARAIAQVADLTDADIAEVNLSRRLAEEAEAQVAPITRLLDLWRALRWRVPGWPPASPKGLAKLGDEAFRAAAAELLSPHRDLVAALSQRPLPGRGPAVKAANALLAGVDALAARERFFHWWTAFPDVFGADGGGGFDIVLGNPPWDRIKLQEVEWFAERDARIAMQPRAADRRARIRALHTEAAPLALQYAEATQRAEANLRVLAKGGDYPLLGGGDVNLYALFVERAAALVRPDGLVSLLVPSGIAADKGMSAFFGALAEGGRLASVYDFENRKGLFPDVDSRFKFCTFTFGGPRRTFERMQGAFFLHALDDLADAARTLVMTPADFALVNPNTRAAPIFRSARDAELTKRLYRRHPVLVRHTNGLPQPVWPVRYSTGFHMTNDSDKFLTAAELRAQRFVPAEHGCWRRGDRRAVPLYVGRMLHQYDHRHADVSVNEGNLHVAAIGTELGAARKADPDRYPVPQYWVEEKHVADRRDWSLAFRDIARATDVRTMIAGIVPRAVAGNTLPLLLIDGAPDPARACSLLLANWNSLAFDFVTRQKAQTTHLNWYIVEQLPVIAPERFDEPLPAAFARRARAEGLMNGHHERPTVADFVVPQVLALSYTAHDLAPFARDLGYVDAEGRVLPPIAWNAAERRARTAALDALFLHLYGLAAEDAAHVLDAFPILREQDEAAFGRYATKEAVLAWLAVLPPPTTTATTV